MEIDMTPVDRTGWPPGPWDDEGDREEWVDAATGLTCLAKRNHLGVWCGYAGVPPGHPWHGMDYGQADAYVHGGLTYAEGCNPEAGICHVAKPGEPDDLWWLGFDTGHMLDIIPRFLAMPELAPIFTPGDDDPFPLVYKDISYVRQECASLALQIEKARLPDEGQGEEKEPTNQDEDEQVHQEP